MGLIIEGTIPRVPGFSEHVQHHLNITHTQCTLDMSTSRLEGEVGNSHIYLAPSFPDQSLKTISSVCPGCLFLDAPIVIPVRYQ